MLIQSKISHSAANIIVGVIIFFLILLGGVYMTQDFDASLVWPASGFGVAIFYIHKKRIWPGLFIGTFLANFVIRFLMLDYNLLSSSKKCW